MKYCIFAYKPHSYPSASYSDEDYMAEFISATNVTKEKLLESLESIIRQNLHLDRNETGFREVQIFQGIDEFHYRLLDPLELTYLLLTTEAEESVLKKEKEEQQLKEELEKKEKEKLEAEKAAKKELRDKADWERLRKKYGHE